MKSQWTWIVGAAVLAAGVTACHPESASQRYAELKCRTSPDDSVIAAAVKGYIKQIDPMPVRFVYMPATDSTPPDAALDVFKKRGPTYMYSSIPAQQAIVYKQLETVGDYTTLLLGYHGIVRKDPLHPVVSLSGHLISGEDSGSTFAKRDIALVCDTTGWVVPPPPKDTTHQDTGKVVITKHARLARP